MSNKMTPVEWLLDQMFNKKELKIISTHTFHISNELADKAKEMEKTQEYETKCLWYGRGILAQKENKIKELKPTLK